MWRVFTEGLTEGHTAAHIITDAPRTERRQTARVAPPTAVAAPVTREKSQFPAQHDSPSLSPVHDGTSLYLTSEPWPPLSFGAAYFRPSIRDPMILIANVVARLILARSRAKMGR